MPPPLLSLPDEVLLDIFSPLLQKDLHSLALVCPQLTGPAQRVLYRSICLDVNNMPSELPIKQRPNILQRTLLENPGLRPFVESLSINVHPYPTKPYEDHQALLRLMPRLQLLSLDPAPANLVIEQLPDSMIRKLRIANISNSEGAVTLYKNPQSLFACIARNFWAPHLLTLTIEACTLSASMKHSFPAERYRTSLVTNLELAHCNEPRYPIGGQTCLPDMLMCIKRLESFSIDFFSPWEGGDERNKNVIEPRTFAQILGMHASSLRRIEIGNSDVAEFCNTSLMGSLAGYPKLKSLVIVETLLGATQDPSWMLSDVLPPNIEDFQLQYPMLLQQGADKNRAIRLKRMKQLAAAKVEHFPSLRRVIWWYQPAECWDDGVGLRFGSVADMESLTALFTEVGVKFQWLTNCSFHETPLISERKFWWDPEDIFNVQE